MGLGKAKGGLGFRDLSCFNSAMLGKQGWRLLKEPQSLVAKVYNEKYYKHIQLLDAPKSSFLIWRSVRSAMAVVKEGLVWRVGNGKSISIWGQRWLPTPNTHCVQSPVRVLHIDSRVCDLINKQDGSWRVDFIAEIFNEEEAEVISTIPISRVGSYDKLI